MPSIPQSPLFDSSFLAKLERLHLLARRVFRGSHRAERRSRQVGSSLEFADYRNYSLGDDLRSVDWNIYSRLERIFVRLFEQEQDLPMYLLVDGSRSMHWMPEGGDPQHSKLTQARRLAAALGYIALVNLDRVDVLWFGSELERDLGLARGKGHFHKILEFLREPPAEPGPTQLLATVRAFTQRRRQRGLVYLLSDFFDPAGYETALNLLRHERFEVNLIQVLDPQELNPGETGDLRLTEPERAGVLEVSADRGLLRAYTATAERYLRGLEEFCARRGLSYARALSTAPFEELVLRLLRDTAMVR